MSGKRSASILGVTLVGALFTIFVPIPAVGIAPWYITHHWMQQPAFFGMEWLRYLGLALVPIGLIVYWLGVTGLGRAGTNPLPPVYSIVSTGAYAWTRNPMYVGVLTAMVGQGLYFGSVGMFYYAFGWWVVFHLFEVTFDEPVLKKEFGKVYTDYIERVPRWIPRPPRAAGGAV